MSHNRFGAIGGANDPSQMKHGEIPLSLDEAGDGRSRSDGLNLDLDAPGMYAHSSGSRRDSMSRRSTGRVSAGPFADNAFRNSRTSKRFALRRR